MSEHRLPLRIAQVGAGEWSRFAHGPSLHRLAACGDVSLEAICDLQIDRARSYQQQFGFRTASTSILDTIAEVRPDAVVCTVHPSATAELVHSLLPLQVPLFIEKPPGISLQEARSLAIASRDHSALATVAFNRRAIPSVLQLKAWAMEHPVRSARVEMLRTDRLEPEFAIHTGIHALDAIRFLIGDPESIHVTPIPHSGSAACDYMVRLSFESSVVVELSLMLHSGMRRETYTLSSNGATVEAILGSAYSSVLCNPGLRFWSSESIVRWESITNDPLIDGGFMGQYEAFFCSIRQNTAPACSLIDAARSMQLAEAVQNCYSGKLLPLNL